MHVPSTDSKARFIARGVCGLFPTGPRGILGVPWPSKLDFAFALSVWASCQYTCLCPCPQVLRSDLGVSQQICAHFAVVFSALSVSLTYVSF